MLGVRFDSLIQPAIDSFNIFFQKNYKIDRDTVELFIIVSQTILLQLGTGGDKNDREFRAIRRTLTYIKNNRQLLADGKIFDVASDHDLICAQRIWWEVLGLAIKIFPEIEPDYRTPKLLSGSQAFAIMAGKWVLPLIVALLAEGKNQEIRLSLRLIRKFIRRFDNSQLIGIIFPEKMGTDFKTALRDLVLELGNIWDQHKFPFLPAPADG